MPDTWNTPPDANTQRTPTRLFNWPPMYDEPYVCVISHYPMVAWLHNSAATLQTHVVHTHIHTSNTVMTWNKKEILFHFFWHLIKDSSDSAISHQTYGLYMSTCGATCGTKDKEVNTANKGMYTPGFPPTKVFLLVADRPLVMWTQTAATYPSKAKL